MKDRICVECGKYFQSQRETKLTCSNQCRKIRDKRNCKLWYERKKSENHNFKVGNHVKNDCRICGKTTDSRLRYHEQCVLNQAIEILKLNNQCASYAPEILRARHLYGYTIKEIKEIMEETDESN